MGIAVVRYDVKHRQNQIWKNNEQRDEAEIEKSVCV